MDYNKLHQKKRRETLKSFHGVFSARLEEQISYNYCNYSYEMLSK